MQRRTLIGSTLSILFASALLAGCGDKAGDAAGGAAPEKKEITLGVTAGSSEEIAEQVAIVAAKKGLTIHVKTFGDYIAVDTALAQGDIDLNAFQHEPYLVNFNSKNNTDLVAIAKTYLAPIAGYSKRWKSVNEVPDGATVTVPNDPTNEGRALYELSRHGWIKLKEGVSTTKLTPNDIVANPKCIKLVELEAALLPRSLDDTDVAIINAGYAISAGLNSQKDSIFVESTETSPYV
ncbi:MAG: metal ABC transporter substrate-binding protein, partial [Sutterella wadsworthensis]|nr:metal ABC transporter substrate-binding protein [Sutterella wadsworthensis]